MTKRDILGHMNDIQLIAKFLLLYIVDEVGRVFLECRGMDSLCLSTESFPVGDHDSVLDVAYCPVCGRRKSKSQRNDN